MMNAHVRFNHVTVRYGSRIAIGDLCLEIPEKQIFGIIGPANSGKTTLLKCINRTIDFIPTARVAGEVFVDGENVFAGSCLNFLAWVQSPWRTFRAYRSRASDVYALRRRVGMVFPLPVGLPLSVYDNVAYAPRRAGMYDRWELDALVEKCLRQAMLWDEVKDRLKTLGTKLSGGQQQRLTLARTLSHRPEILCLDEFSIAIDPVTTMKIEDILRELKNEITIVLVTNLVQQARRLADRTAFMSDGRLIEADETETLFERPANILTKRYVDGDFG